MNFKCLNLLYHFILIQGLLATNFKDWKYGDRWWFENGNDKKIKFTPPQLDEIRSTSFSRLVCDNIDVEYVQELAFLWPNDKYNRFTSKNSKIVIKI